MSAYHNAVENKKIKSILDLRFLFFYLVCDAVSGVTVVAGMAIAVAGEALKVLLYKL